jgi:hypothetical protein
MREGMGKGERAEVRRRGREKKRVGTGSENEGWKEDFISILNQKKMRFFQGVYKKKVSDSSPLPSSSSPSSSSSSSSCRSHETKKEMKNQKMIIII